MLRPGHRLLPPRLRVAAGVWIVFVVLLQGWLMGYEATVMASGGIEVCSASGSKRVDRQGNPLPSHLHASHDCCCAAASLLPPMPVDAAVLAVFGHEAPASRLSAGRLGMEWRAPLSRGPPLFPAL